MTTLPGAAILIALYCLAHAVMRLATSQNLGENDPAIALSIQDGLLWSYRTGEPPLFEWLAFLVSELFGPTALTFQILRYGFLILSLIAIFLIARRITGSGLWSLITVESYALVYQISWRVHEGFTHPVVAMAGVAITFYAMLRLMDRCSIINVALFATALTIGFMSNAWFYTFLAAFGLAALSVEAARRVLLSPLVMLGIVLAVLSAVPYWQADSRFFQGIGWQIFQAPEDVMSVGFLTRLAGFFEGVAMPLWFLSPLLPVVVVWFWRPLWHARLGPARADDDAEKFLLRSVLVALAGLAVFGLFMGYQGYPEHALMPLFLLVPILLIRWVQRTEPSIRHVQRFVTLCLLFMVVTFGARAANLVILDPVCNRCYFGIPFEGLADEVDTRFSPDLVIADHRRWSGSYRAFLPDTVKVLDWGWPQQFTPQLLATTGHVATVLVLQDEAHVERMMVYAERFGFQATGEVMPVDIPWPHLFRPSGYRTSTWWVVPGIIPAGEEN